MVSAAGNGGTDGVGDDNDSIPFYPASYDSANIIAVAATNKYDYMPSFSNYGDESVDLGAPGDGILSTRPGDRYFTKSGTSMATPYVSGVAALINAFDLGLTNLKIKEAILNNVDVRNSLTGKVLTGGRLNAYNALSSVLCTNLPVRSMETGMEYQTLRGAYIAAVSGYTIQSQIGVLTEDPIFDMNKSVSIDGGFDCSYTDNTDRETTISGNITISNGTLIIQSGTFKVQ